MVSDILTTDMLNKIPKGAIIADIGSKFTKIIDYMPHSDFHLIAIRPELLSVDTDYLKKNLTQTEYETYKDKGTVQVERYGP